MPRPGRRFIFFYQLTLLLGLLALAFAYYQADAVIDVVPVVFQGLPVQVAWFGALGGVVISLKGVYDHPAGSTRGTPEVLAWNDKWLLWHLGRPFSGMVAGIITLVLLKAIYPKGSPAQAIVFAAAFILGTQERRFFEFLKQVGAVIVAVPDKKDSDAES